MHCIRILLICDDVCLRSFISALAVNNKKIVLSNFRTSTYLPTEFECQNNTNNHNFVGAVLRRFCCSIICQKSVFNIWDFTDQFAQGGFGLKYLHGKIFKSFAIKNLFCTWRCTFEGHLCTPYVLELNFSFIKPGSKFCLPCFVLLDQFCVV